MSPLVRFLAVLIALFIAIGPVVQSLPADPGPTLGDPEEMGAWLAPFDGEVPAVNLALLPDGRVLYYSGVEADEHDHDHEWTFFTSEPVPGVSRVLDLSGPTPVVLEPSGADGAGQDLFCSGFVHLADGRVLAAGGTDWDTLPEMTTPVQGIVDSRIFDPATNAWERVDDMDVGRWYPSVFPAADGTPIVASGITNLTMPHTMVLPWEAYDEDADAWSTVAGADRLLPMYPRLSVVPGGPLKGDVFYNTVGTLWGPFGEHPAEGMWSMQQSFDTDEGAWTTFGPSLFGARQHAANVMLPLTSSNAYAPEYLTFGGTLQRSVVAVPFSERISLADDRPVNTRTADLNHARWHHNGVLLPTGQILAVGGGAIDNVVVHGQENPPVLTPELYDPDTDTWTPLADMTIPRMYHSTAILLPDGSVLAGGHVPLPNPWPQARDTFNPQTKETRFEIFQPPYMFRGDRPEILAAPDTIGYGETFEVEVRLQTPIESVMLVRPGATTHAFDSTQRIIELDVLASEVQAASAASFDDNVELLSLGAPPDGAVAPPGWYMLFINRDGGGQDVPSEAAWVHVS